MTALSGIAALSLHEDPHRRQPQPPRAPEPGEDPAVEKVPVREQARQAQPKKTPPRR